LRRKKPGIVSDAIVEVSEIEPVAIVFHKRCG
jgi:hypothetical protein